MEYGRIDKDEAQIKLNKVATAKVAAAGALGAITDGSGGTANDATGVGAITDAATKNAVATLVAKVNALVAALT